MLFGGINFRDFDAENGPAEAKKAWAGVQGWTGSSFKPVAFLGDQPCKGTNYWFLAEETVNCNPVQKKMVVFAINGFQDHYAIVPSSIHEVKFEI